MADEYDPQDDAVKSYYAAIDAKRLRGDAGLVVPEGWQLVPLEPTRDMTMAACDALPCVDGVFGFAGKIAANVYRYMLKAAPRYDGGRQ